MGEGRLDWVRVRVESEGQLTCSSLVCNRESGKGGVLVWVRGSLGLLLYVCVKR